MGQSKRRDKVRCSVCLSKSSVRNWNNVGVVRITASGLGVKLECKNCSHTWTSYSVAALRLIQSIPTNEDLKR